MRKFQVINQNHKQAGKEETNEEMNANENKGETDKEQQLCSVAGAERLQKRVEETALL